MEKPLRTELPKQENVADKENLSERISLKAYALDDSVTWGQSFRLKVSFHNLSTDTLTIITGYHTLKLETTRDTALASRIDSLELQMNAKISITLLPYTTHAEIINDNNSNSIFNTSTDFSILFPLDSLSETVFFHCTASTGLQRSFHLVYNTENYTLPADTTILKVNKPRIVTGRIISKPVFIDVLQPIKHE